MVQIKGRASPKYVNQTKYGFTKELNFTIVLLKMVKR